MNDWPVLVINLERSPERWGKIQKLFPNEDFVRIEGIDGWQWQGSGCLPDGRPEFKEGSLDSLYKQNILGKGALDIWAWIPAEVGCALSHIKAWEYIIENDIEWAIILEDDAEPTDNFSDTLQNSLEREFIVPDDAEVIFLTGEDNAWGSVVIDENNRLKSGFGNTGYAISLQGALRAYEAQLPMYLPCDMQWWMRAFKDLNMFGNIPLPQMKKGQTYALSKGIVDIDTANWSTTMTPSGKKPWKRLVYERDERYIG